MANYTAADIKALREPTGAGMLDVKKALDEADGDRAKATEILRVKGLKGVTKREGRTTSNGLVAAKAEDGVGTLVEVLCETDFVAKSEKFIALADQVLAQAVAVGRGRRRRAAEEHASRTAAPSRSCSTRPTPTIGEKIEVKRVARVEAPRRRRPTCTRPAPTCLRRSVSSSAPRAATSRSPATSPCTSPPSPPTVLTRDEVDAETVENERRVAEATAKEEGKPEAALPKIVEGRVNGFFKENVLLEQPFAKDAKKTVAKVLEEAGAKATSFARFRVGG